MIFLAYYLHVNKMHIAQTFSDINLKTKQDLIGLFGKGIKTQLPISN